ncbi:uncharacterized protein N7477_005792 [Penicillium maclennaniae]|uniref:uncharacterized protein n=1 Tax=Penicillium maclennaniae TaxID=1343394 RepID=UPI002540B66C|nr:uncharacterized protein N7477_005792 [Penicillium maclennaniae]KAJ5670429.1 hypothetical protein N7477_005792 [Penicillium maclennaniae]
MRIVTPAFPFLPLTTTFLFTGHYDSRKRKFSWMVQVGFGVVGSKDQKTKTKTKLPNGNIAQDVGSAQGYVEEHSSAVAALICDLLLPPPKFPNSARKGLVWDLGPSLRDAEPVTHATQHVVPLHVAAAHPPPAQRYSVPTGL